MLLKHWHDEDQQSLVDACKTKKENQTLNCIQINNLGGLNAKINKLSISKSNIYKFI